jgi:serine/threonine protein kinase
MGCVASSEPKTERKETPQQPPKASEPVSQPKAVDPTPPAADPKGKAVAEQSAAAQDASVIRAPVEDHYTLGKELGRGGFSVVVEATKKTDGSKVAVKRIRKDHIEGDDIKLLLREVCFSLPSTSGVVAQSWPAR